MDTAIREALKVCNNRRWIDLDYEVEEAIRYVHLVSVLVNKEPETITMLTIQMMQRMPNLSFSQALGFVFPDVPLIDMSEMNRGQFREKKEQIKEKPVLKKKTALVVNYSLVDKIRKIIQNQFVTCDLEKETKEATEYIETIKNIVKKTPEEIVDLIYKQTLNWTNLPFVKAAEFVFPELKYSEEKRIEEKPVLKKKTVAVPIVLLKKKRVIPGRLF